MSQLSLTYVPEDLGRATWQVELEWARRAVAAIGPKEVAWALNTSASQLSDALAERPRDKEDDDKRSKRSLRAEWMAVIRAMAPVGLQLEWLRIVCPPLGHEPKRIQIKTSDQKLREREEWLKAKASVVYEQMEKELG